MPDIMREPIETTEEHLADEIRELERPVLASWQTWAAALAAFAALALIVAAFMIWETANITKMTAERIAATPPVVMKLVSLQQSLESNSGSFRWEPVAGATSYVFIVRDARGSGEVLLIRSLEEPFVTTTDVEAANLRSGRFEWSVEARRADGRRAGYGEGTFKAE